MPDRGLLAPLSPHEEVTLRIVELADLPARDVERLKVLLLVEENGGAACGLRLQVESAISRCRGWKGGGQLRNHPPWGEAAPHGSFMRGLTDRPLFSGGEWELIGFGEPTALRPKYLCRHCDIAGEARAVSRSAAYPWSQAPSTYTRQRLRLLLHRGLLRL